MNKILTISKPKIVYLTDKVQLEAIVKTDSFEKKCGLGMIKNMLIFS